MPWVVYNGDRRIVGIFEAQAAANTLADSDSDYTAHGSETTGDDWDENAQLDWYFTSAGAVQRYPSADTTALGTLKGAIRNALSRHAAIGAALIASSPGRPPSDDEKLRTFMWRSLQGFYTMMNDTSLTVAIRTTVAQEFGEGPADTTITRGTENVPDVAKWWEVVHTATAPTTMVSYVARASQSRMNLGSAETVSGNEPAASVDILAGGWVDDITS